MPEHLDFDRFDPTGFEEFCFELMTQVGFVNVDWRKGTDLTTSPSDSGRDIVAQLEVADVDGARRFETWFVDCKHQKKGVPPRELQGLLTWANAERPDVALFMLSGFLSNPSKDNLKTYESQNRPPFRIKYWERSTLERIVDGKDDFLRRFFFDLPRSEGEILEAEQEFFDRVWYERSIMLNHTSKDTPEDIREGMLRARTEIKDRHGAANLGPYSDFDWGMINGKLSALRWMLGDDWDMLDT